jgi:hypothetical protein
MVNKYANGGLLSEVSSFGTPAQQPIIPYPFQELASMGAQVQQRADKNRDQLNLFGDYLLKQQVLRGDEEGLRSKFMSYYDDMEKIIDESGGVMSDLNFTNKSRNLVRQYSSDPDLINYSRNYSAVMDEQKKMLSITDYKPYNDPNAAIRTAALNGTITLGRDAYTQRSYLGNENIPEALDKILDKAKADSHYGEGSGGDGYIYGGGNKELTVDKLTGIALNQFGSFISSDAGREFLRRAEYQKGAPLKEEDVFALYSQEMKGRISELAYNESRNTMKADSNTSGNNYTPSGPEQLVKFTGMESTYLAGNLKSMGFNENADGVIEVTDDIRKIIGTEISRNAVGMAIQGEKKTTPTSNLPKNVQQIIDIAYTVMGKKPTGLAAPDFAAAQEYVQTWLDNKKSMEVKTSSKKEGTEFTYRLDTQKENLSFIDPDSRTKSSLSWDQISDGASKIKYNSTLKANNPFSPAAQIVTVTNSSGEEKTYIASNLDGGASKEYHTWIMMQPFNQVDGDFVAPADYTTYKSMMSENLTSEEIRTRLKAHNAPRFESKVEKDGDGNLIIVGRVYENNKVTDTYKAPYFSTQFPNK